MTISAELKKVPNETLSSSVYKVLRLSILSGDLEAGQSLCIGKLADDLGVSTTPVREALVRLVGDGLVCLQKSHQPIVTVISREEVAHLYAIRRLLEPYFGQCLAVRAIEEPRVMLELRELRDDVAGYTEKLDEPYNDPDLYGEYVELERRLQEALLPSGEPDILGKTAALVNNYIYRLRIFSHETHSKERRTRMRAVCAEHLRILDAVLGGNNPGIETTILDHLMRSEERSLKAL